MRKTIYFHVGHPKCGSSSIQTFCNQNRDQLLADGFSYPAISNLPFHGEISPAFYKSAGSADRSRHYLDGLLVSIRETPSNSIILSSESFFADEIELFEAFREFDLKFIYYIRRQDDYLESALNQRLKEGNLGYFYPIQKHLPLLQQLDYLNCINKFASIFGNDAIDVRLFSRQLFIDGDLIQDFLSAIGCKDRTKYSFVASINSSLRGSVLKFAAHLAFIPLSPLERKQVTDELVKISCPEEEHITLLSHTDKIGLLDVYCKSNREIALRFLKKYDEPLLESFTAGPGKIGLLYTNVLSLFPRIDARLVRKNIGRLAMTPAQQREVFFSLPAELRSLIISRTPLSSSYDPASGKSYVTFLPLPRNRIDYQLALLRRDQSMIARELFSLSASYQRYSRPILLEVFEDFNLVFHRDKYFGIPKTLPIDWENSISFGINPEIKKALTMAELKNSILKEAARAFANPRPEP